MAKQSTTSRLREVEEMSTAELLAAARRHRREADAHEAELLVIAGQWADVHPAESVGDEAVFVHGEHVEPIAGPGCPAVAEFCIAELGAVLGLSTTAARRLVGHVLELRHRLPRLLAEVLAGRVPAWRARRVAEATIHAAPALTAESMAWIDAHVAPFAARVGQAQVDRLVEEAIRRQCPPEPVDPDDPSTPDRRHVTIDLDQVQPNGTVLLHGEVDLADGIDLDRTLGQRAAALTGLGSTASLGARRAMALGDMSRTQLALDLTARAERDRGPATPTVAHPSRPGDAEPAGRAAGHDEAFSRTAREVVLHLHLSAADTGSGGAGIDRWGRLEEGQRLVLLDQVRAWCGRSHTRVTLKPVIDLATELSTTSCAPTPRQREQVVLRDQTCTFPWCSRSARRCDIDHVIPFDHDAAAHERPQSGPTATSNLAALCRTHHRLKTHGRWRVRPIASGVLEWTSPHGHLFLRDRTGTSRVDPDDRSGGTPTDPGSPARDPGPQPRP